MYRSVSAVCKHGNILVSTCTWSPCYTVFSAVFHFFQAHFTSSPTCKIFHIHLICGVNPAHTLINILINISPSSAWLKLLKSSSSVGSLHGLLLLKKIFYYFFGGNFIWKLTWGFMGIEKLVFTRGNNVHTHTHLSGSWTFGGMFELCRGCSRQTIAGSSNRLGNANESSRSCSPHSLTWSRTAQPLNLSHPRKSWLELRDASWKHGDGKVMLYIIWIWSFLVWSIGKWTNDWCQCLDRPCVNIFLLVLSFASTSQVMYHISYFVALFFEYLHFYMSNWQLIEGVNALRQKCLDWMFSYNLKWTSQHVILVFRIFRLFVFL